MSFFDDASLVFLPSGEAGKDGKAYSMKPTDGSGDFTFSRGSNLTATRVDSNGLIEKGRENLLLQSNQFNTTWTTSNASVTSGQSGYDGSSNAWLLESTATTTSMRLQQGLTSSSILSYSVYAKKGTADWLSLRSNSSTTAVWFDLSNGVIGQENTDVIDSSIESIGDGWYRLSVIFSSCTSVRLYVTDGDNVFTTTLGDNIYIQDAQLEIGLVATEYIESGASTGLGGLLEDSPRFDYSGGASCPSLLLEPSRTNLIGYSEYYNDWDKNSGTTLTANNAISPDGNQNATLVECPLTGGRVGYDVALTSGTTYTFSIYLKNNGGNTSISIGSHGTAQLETITINNDWNRYSTTFTATSTITSNIRFVSSGSNINMYAFGAQLEQGSYPTSYMPNHSGGSVTRELDHCFTSSNSVLEEINATYFLEVTPIQITSNNILEVRANGSTNNRIVLQTNSGGALRVLVRAQGSSVLDQNISGAVSANTKVKIALKYTDRTNISVFVDGVKEIDSDLVIDFSPELNGLDLEGSATANNDSLKQHQFIFFPSALSDANCITLTS